MSKYRGYDIRSGRDHYSIYKEGKFIMSVQNGDNPEVEIDKLEDGEDDSKPNLRMKVKEALTNKKRKTPTNWNSESQPNLYELDKFLRKSGYRLSDVLSDNAVELVIEPIKSNYLHPDIAYDHTEDTYTVEVLKYGYLEASDLEGIIQGYENALAIIRHLNSIDTDTLELHESALVSVGNKLREGLKPSKAKRGEIYSNTKNITSFRIASSEADAKDNNNILLKAGYYNLSKEEKADILKFIEDSPLKDHIQYSKTLSSIKITPGLDLELLEFSKSAGVDHSVFKIVGTDYYIYCRDSFKYVDLKSDAEDTTKSTPKAGILYALYGTGNAYSTGSRYEDSINWHWTINDDMTDAQFRKSVKNAALKAAEKEFHEYDPSSIQVKFFKSKEAFLAYCKKIDFHPNV